MLFGSDLNNDRKDFIFKMLEEGIVDLDIEKEIVVNE